MSDLQEELRRLHSKHVRVWPQFQALTEARKQARARRRGKLPFAIRQEKIRLQQAEKLARVERQM